MSRGEEGTRGRGRHICFCFNKNKIKGNTQSGKHLKKIIKFAVSVQLKNISFYKYLTYSELINIMIMYARTDISLFTDAPHSRCTPFTNTLVFAIFISKMAYLLYCHVILNVHNFSEFKGVSVEGARLVHNIDILYTV